MQSVYNCIPQRNHISRVTYSFAGILYLQIYATRTCMKWNEMIWYGIWYMVWYDMTYLLTVTGLKPGASIIIIIITAIINIILLPQTNQVSRYTLIFAAILWLHIWYNYYYYYYYYYYHHYY